MKGGWGVKNYLFVQFVTRVDRVLRGSVVILWNVRTGSQADSDVEYPQTL